ncbi:MAG TPA: YraN family protein [Limnochordia bacterium]
MMRDPSLDPKRLGQAGERAAARYLAAHGYRIVEANFRCRAGEIDLVAREGDVLVFVEVRTRRGHTFGRPEESITPAKQRRLRRLARWYLAARAIPPATPCRFDVVCASAGPDGAIRKIELLRDAFRGA